MQASIVGAGIGGLCAALALHREGIDVHVYEQASILREVGAGLAISPNAVKVLQHLGLTDALRSFGIAPQSFDYRDWRTGALLGRVPLAEAAVARWGALFYHIHRADLHDALRMALGDERITLGAKCVSVEQSRSAVTARCADGRQITSDLLIGADGIHSVVRDYVAGPDRPVWARQISWRGLAPASVGHELELDARHHSFWGPRKQFVAFYVASEKLVNWVGNTQSDDAWSEESWSARGCREDVQALFADWHPQVQGLIERTDSVFKWALFEREPLVTWTRGRVTLLGDAAHPMLPYMAQGASQSIEDALVLARCLAAQRNDPESALGAYTSRRKDRATRVQTASRDAGRMMQLTDPAEVEARNARLSANPEAPTARFDWVWSHDALSLRD